jgi:hypothetical protein
MAAQPKPSTSSQALACEWAFPSCVDSHLGTATLAAAAVAVLAIAFLADAMPSWRAARVDAAHRSHQE